MIFHSTLAANQIVSQFHAATAQPAADAGRISVRHRVSRDVFGNDAPHSDETEISGKLSEQIYYTIKRPFRKSPVQRSG